MAANGQLSWPSAVSFVTVSGQDLMAADMALTAACGRNRTSTESRI